MPDSTSIFVVGVGLGCGLLIIGGLIGYWIGLRAGGQTGVADKQQFLDFLRDLSAWTAEFSGDVTKYQSQLSDLSQRASGGNGSIGGKELQSLLSRIMDVNDQLQNRLDSAEQRLEKQTDQISSYLTEARTDGLTGLMNRRAFDKATDELFAGWQNQDQPFSLGLIDIDYFKKINDNYGHQAGDEILKQLSSLMQAELSGSFCLARYGGEEFAVLSKEPADAIAKALDQMRETASELNVSFEGKTIPITISCGASSISAGDRIGNVVRRADEALYASKLGGRNRVHLHDGTICHLITKVVEQAPASNNHQSAAQRRDVAENETKVQQRLRRIVEEESRRILDR
ncbi:MAG: GGDEF domain-containing protein [Aureliella sp.]